jgi:hypothetical protein
MCDRGEVRLRGDGTGVRGDELFRGDVLLGVRGDGTAELDSSDPPRGVIGRGSSMMIRELCFALSRGKFFCGTVGLGSPVHIDA